MGQQIGIDIGGTFTDLVVLESDGTVLTCKVLSTPENYSRGIVDGLSSLIDRNNLNVDEITQIIHGTTIATNAILEGKGARVALITTTGFRDVLEIRRLRMPALYDIRWRKPTALVPRKLRFEVPERIDNLGRVERPLDETAVREVIEQILSSGVDSIAVCLINAYANGQHEERIRDLIQARNNSIPVSLSSELVPEIKEYERTSTAVVNAYVLPPVRNYLGRLSRELDAGGISKPLQIMQSNGGVMPAAAAANRPFHIIESGPAAGVVGAAELARILGNVNVLTLDMGGTTAKAAVVDRGHFLRVSSFEVGGGINISGRLLKGGGYHVSAPSIDIAEVGAGGGSIVSLDAGGAMRIGPESAGAVPGPACYGRGGTMPTVADANVVLGLINPDALAGGSLPIRRCLAVKALDEAIARPLGLSTEDTAWGIHRIANATMARALRAVSTERGLDPRGFTLMAFGGNGPVHAATMARSLNITRILIPPIPGVFSSLGMLFPEVEHHYVQTYKRPLGALDAAALETEFCKIESGGAKQLLSEGYADAHHRFERLIELRYVSASSELTLPCPETGELIPQLLSMFEDAYERQFGYRSPEEVVEVVNLRVIARAAGSTKRVPDALQVAAAPQRAVETRRFYIGPEHGWITSPVIGRADLNGDWRCGPLLIEEYDSTTMVPPGARARRIKWDAIEIELEAADAAPQ